MISCCVWNIHQVMRAKRKVIFVAFYRMLEDQPTFLCIILVRLIVQTPTYCLRFRLIVQSPTYSSRLRLIVYRKKRMGGRKFFCPSTDFPLIGCFGAFSRRFSTLCRSYKEMLQRPEMAKYKVFRHFQVNKNRPTWAVSVV